MFAHPIRGHLKLLASFLSVSHHLLLFFGLELVTSWNRFFFQAHKFFCTKRRKQAALIFPTNHSKTRVYRNKCLTK